MKSRRVNRALRWTVLVSALSATFGALAAPLDLTTADQSGYINGAYFNNAFNRLPVGTGVIDPFLSLQKNGTESGFNTDANPLPLDAKRATNFTDPITVNQIGQVTGDGTFGASGVLYRQFFLDINESNGSNPPLDAFLSLDKLQIGFGSVGDLSIFPTVAWDMDGAEDTAVLLNYDLNSGSGLGFDLTFLIEESVFSGRPAGSDYVYMFAEFGTTGVSGNRNYGTSDGFEEFWALRATPVDCVANPNDPACGPPPTDIPEPGTLLLAGLALLGLAASRRRC